MTSAPFLPVTAARALLRTARSAALATLDPATGGPFASLVTVATAPDGAPLMLLSTLAVHTRNLLQDPRASILIDDRHGLAAGDALADSRLTVTGRIAKVAETDTAGGEAVARRRFLARHPEAESYANFRDFAFYRFDIETAHLVAGFGRINDIAAADLLIGLSDAEDVIAAEPGIIAHMNADHAATTRLYATRLLRQPEGEWSVIGCDPGGLDLAADIAGRWHDVRLAFPRLVRSSGPLRAILKELATDAGKAEGPKSI